MNDNLSNAFNHGNLVGFANKAQTDYGNTRVRGVEGGLSNRHATRNKRKEIRDVKVHLVVCRKGRCAKLLIVAALSRKREGRVDSMFALLLEEEQHDRLCKLHFLVKAECRDLCCLP
jgi:hypothetical protein